MIKILRAFFLSFLAIGLVVSLFAYSADKKPVNAYLLQGSACDPNNPDHDQAFCVDDDLDNVGECVCTADAFFGDAQALCADQESIDTAIGCIPVKSDQKFAEFVLSWAMGIGGGVAFLLGIVAGFIIMTSSGDPQRLNSGKALLMAALSGLFLLLGSAFILRIVGVELFGIPGL